MSADRQRCLPTSPRLGSVVRAVEAYRYERGGVHLALPRTEVQLVVRFAEGGRREVDLHALGPQSTVRRKQLLAGQRAMLVRLQSGVSAGLLGAPPSMLAGRVVPLDALWGESVAGPIVRQLASVTSDEEAARVLEAALTTRMETVLARSPHARLVATAAPRLELAPVGLVADALGVSERHLRRAFHDVMGLGPKTYARVARFHRALAAARASEHPCWASIAVAAGYYDQAHLIAEFRAIAGATPSALLREVRAASHREA